MNKTSNQDRVRVIASLIEGNSIASTVRMTGIAKTTILRLIRDLADVCETLHNETVKDLTCRRIQMDEIWAFVGAKDKNASMAKKMHLKWGDAWTWTAIDADTKLMVTWLVGPRHAGTARQIMDDLAWRLKHRIQLTTDGLGAYWYAAERVFGQDVDYAQLVKIYGIDRTAGNGKYSPSECLGVEIHPKIGSPDHKHVSTSYVERSNLTVRMGMRRYTRLTNGHSKKIENHMAMTTIFFTYYNFCRIHQTLKVTPAMEAKLTTKLWEIEDLVGLLK